MDTGQFSDLKLLAFIFGENIENLEDGRVNLLGAPVDEIAAPPGGAADAIQIPALISFAVGSTDAATVKIRVDYQNLDRGSIGVPWEKLIPVNPNSISTGTPTIQAEYHGPGHYQFDLYLDDLLMTSHPLRVV